MYIPKDIIWFILGFISFPIVIGCVYQIKVVWKKGKEVNKDNGFNKDDIGTLNYKEKIQQVKSKTRIENRRIRQQDNTNEHSKKNPRKTKRNVGKDI